MRISFAGFWLCADPSKTIREHSPAMLLDKSASRMQQLVSGPAWNFQEGHDRQNQWTTISFKAEKVFTNEQQAEAYILGYEATGHHPMKGSLRIVLDGASPTECYLHNALISLPSFSHMGCRVFATYSCGGPQFTAAAGASYYLFSSYGGSLFPKGEDTPASGQGFEISGTSLIPKASVTTDPNWTISGNSIIPTGV